MSTNFLLHVVSGAERLTEFRIAVEAAFPYSATNYHVLSLLRRRMKPDGVTLMSFGEPIVAYSLKTRSLPAKTPVVLYTNPIGLALKDDERLFLQIADTGSPAALTSLTWELDVQGVSR